MKNWFREPWKRAGNRQGVDLNLNPKNQEEQYYRAESHITPYNRNYKPFIIAGHGGKAGIVTYSGYNPNSRERGDATLISVEELAQMIKSNPAWEKSSKIVILYSCNVGLVKNGERISYAQKLANALGKGVIVYAPNGYITVGWLDKENEIETKTGETGKMLKFVGEDINEK